MQFFLLVEGRSEISAHVTFGAKVVTCLYHQAWTFLRKFGGGKHRGGMYANVDNKYACLYF